MGLDAGWLAQIKVNLSPVLVVPADQLIEELSTLVVTNTATDADANSLTFGLVSGPAGVVVDPLSGVLSWTPTEAEGPSTNWITVRVTDNGSPPLSTTNSFRVVVNEVNTQPRLTLPPELTIDEQRRLAFDRHVRRVRGGNCRCIHASIGCEADRILPRPCRQLFQRSLGLHP